MAATWYLEVREGHDFDRWAESFGLYRILSLSAPIMCPGERAARSVPCLRLTPLKDGHTLDQEASMENGFT